MSSHVGPTEDFVGTERFKRIRKVGSGAFGVVYEVFDRETQSRVALKILKRFEGDALLRFKLEFRALADTHHPNLVSLHELVADENQWFLIMELVHGMDFLNYVSKPHAFVSTPQEVQLEPNSRAVCKAKTLPLADASHPVEEVLEPLSPPKAPPRQAGHSKGVDTSKTQALPATASFRRIQCDLDRLLHCLPQLVQAVEALHGAGKLHRDLKPSNVMVDHQGRVVVMDFGLVYDYRTRFLNDSIGKSRVGTPAYMSPEQLCGVQVTCASDWYSIGVMLFEALTGELPYDGSMFKVIHDKVHSTAPKPPGWLVSEVPPALDALCLRLLGREPELRPSGLHILRVLSALTHANDPIHRPVRHQTCEEVGGLQPWVPQSGAEESIETLVGREEELATLKNALGKVGRSKAAFVVVRGPSGIGKTTLVNHFLTTETKPKEHICFVGRCFEQESVPFKALDSIIDALARHLQGLSEAERVALVPRHADALVLLFPVLGFLENGTHEVLSECILNDGGAIRRRAFAALRDLLIRVSTSRCIIIFIDDLQWGDEDSAAAIIELVRGPSPPQLLLIAGCRNEMTHGESLVQSILDRLKPDDIDLLIEHVNVRELKLEEACTLARHHLPTYLASASLADRIAKDSEGIPLFVREMVRHVEGAHDTVPATFTGTHSSIRLEQVLEARFAHLPAAALKLLNVVALAGQAIQRGNAANAAGVQHGGSEFFKVLNDHNLILTRGRRSYDMVEPFHDRIRQACIARLSKESLKRIHRAIAQALEASKRADLETIAHHYLNAEAYPQAARYAVEAAAQADRSLAFERAVRLYRLGVNVRAQRQESVDPDLMTRLAQALVNDGRAYEAAQVFLKSTSEYTSSQSLELQRMAIGLLLQSGHIDEGLEVLRQVSRHLGITLPVTPFRTLCSFLWQRLLIRMRGLSVRTRSLERASIGDLIRADLCWSLSIGLPWIDTLRGADFQSRYTRLALRIGDPVRVARALMLEAGYSAILGTRSRRRARLLSDRALALAEQHKDVHLEGLAKIAGAICLFFEGQFKEAYALFSACDRLFRQECVGVSFERAITGFYRQLSLSFMGQWGEIARTLPAHLSELREHGDLFGQTCLETRIAYIPQLLEDRPHRALTLANESIARWSKSGFHIQHFWHRYACGEIALYRGAEGVALELANGLWRDARRVHLLRNQGMRIEALCLKTRAELLCASRARKPLPDKKARRMRWHIHCIHKERVAWANPLANLLEASLAFLRHNMPQTQRLLQRAEQEFDAVDMEMHSAVCRLLRGRGIGVQKDPELVASALERLAVQGVTRPERIVQLLAPGTWCWEEDRGQALTG